VKIDLTRAHGLAQRGFTLVTAIFLLVVLAALGVFIVSVTGLQHSTQALDVQGVRAYQAARSGIEWGAYQVLDPDSTPGTCDPLSWPATCVSATLPPLAGSLSAYTVTVACTESTAKEGNREVHTYEIVATACNQATCPSGTPAPAGYVERKLTAVLSKCKDPTAAAPRCACG
jgi:MSHA biogenesis protein MshP